MSYYILWGSIGVIFLILEMFTPGLFFLNFSISAFICAILALSIKALTMTNLIIFFCVLSVILIFTLRPMLIKRGNNQTKEQSGIEAKYVGQIAKVVENVDKEKGAISIYDERWQARNIEEGVIEAGCQVEIVGYESIVMKVKKV